VPTSCCGHVHKDDDYDEDLSAEWLIKKKKYEFTREQHNALQYNEASAT